MKKRVFTGTDYSKHAERRKRMAHYLKSAEGGFKQISGYILPDRRTKKYRLILIISALILTIIGLYNALF